jgi:8-oxo-dGTP diphosphatase
MTSVPTDGQHAAATIDIVAAVVFDPDGRVLVVRKQGSDTFIQPGGKPEPGEAPLVALARELHEELGVALDPASAVPLGRFEAWAVHEAGHRVRAHAYLVTVIGMPRAQAEIAELAWVPLHLPHGVRLAPLSADHILPAAANAVAAT